MAELNQVLKELGADRVQTLKQLHEIQSKNPPSIAYLPYADNTYDIDLNTRTISGPAELGTQRDHKAEVVYFKIDRYFDYMDLANTACVIEYVLPKDEDKIPYIYIVPFYDTAKFLNEGKMIIPWVVGADATSQEGMLEYAVRFFKVSEDNGELRLAYNLSTLPSKSKVNKSLQVNHEIMNAGYDGALAGKYQNLIYQVQNSRTTWQFLE